MGITKEAWQASCNEGERIARESAVDALRGAKNPQEAFGILLGMLTEIPRIMRKMGSNSPEGLANLEFMTTSCVRGAVRGADHAIDENGDEVRDLSS